MPDLARLTRVIAKQGFNIDALADKMGIDKSTLYRKLEGGGKKFMMWEVESIIDHLDLTIQDAREIFLP